MSDDQRDRQSDADDVGDDSDGAARQREGAVTIAREWHHDPIHHQIYRDAVERSCNDRVPGEVAELTTGEVEHCRRGKRDEEVKSQPKSCRWPSSVVRIRAQQTGGDSFQDSRRQDSFRPPRDECGGDIHDAAREACRNDGRQRGGRIHAERVNRDRCRHSVPRTSSLRGESPCSILRRSGMTKVMP